MGFQDLMFPSSLRMAELGMQVHVVEPRLVPVLSVSESVTMTDEFRQEVNAWLLDMFGSKEICAIPKGQAIVFGYNVIMRPETAVLISNLAI